MPSNDQALSHGRRRLWRLAPLAVACCLVVTAMVASSSTAAPPAPQGGANCGGTLTPAPTSDDPHGMTYKFRCNDRISAYSLIINRRRKDIDTIDNFSTTADVTLPNGGVDTKNDFTCEGSLPGDSVSCNDGVGSTGPNVIGAFSTVNGTISLTDPYCAFYPKVLKRVKRTNGHGFKKVMVKSKIAEPAAYVQLIVTNASGAQDGPFRLTYDHKCPKLKKPKKTTP